MGLARPTRRVASDEVVGPARSNRKLRGLQSEPSVSALRHLTRLRRSMLSAIT
jgi:hypothetical protein